MWAWRGLLLTCLPFLLFPVAFLQSIVPALPGFPGFLPFKLETGYVGVGEDENVQLFYYFVESTRKPDEDPLLLWLAGGPACSSFRAFFYENGPLIFDYTYAADNFPRLKLNPYSWTKVANMLFVDQPAGTGFSYSKTTESSKSGDTLSAKHTYDFLLKWLLDHPKFRRNPLYVAGISYMGIIVPSVALQIYQGNERGDQPPVNIKGYVLSSPLTDKDGDANSRINYGHRMALLSDELYESVRANCRGNYVRVDSNDKLCNDDLERVDRCTRGINFQHILEPLCEEAELPKIEQKPNRHFTMLQEPSCRDGDYLYMEVWANERTVQEALHIREGTINVWEKCKKSSTYSFDVNDTVSYSFDVSSSVGLHKQLLDRDCRALIFSGDHDMSVPHVGTEKWVGTLNLTLESVWKPWLVSSQIAGYVTTFSNQQYRLTYATVKGAGHTVPEYKPGECLAMVERWLGYRSLSDY